eukprot:15232221-Alexandrium_andersonii.AAC.1
MEIRISTAPRSESRARSVPNRGLEVRNFDDTAFCPTQTKNARDSLRKFCGKSSSHPRMKHNNEIG